MLYSKEKIFNKKVLQCVAQQNDTPAELCIQYEVE